MPRSTEGVYAALEAFRYGPRNGRPTAIICHGMKGQGALSDFLNKHKVTVPDPLIEQELALQAAQRRDRVAEFNEFHEALGDQPDGASLQASLTEAARRMHLDTGRGQAGKLSLKPEMGPVLTRRAPARNKRVKYDPAQLPRLDRTRQYAASEVVTAAMKVFAKDPSVVSIDSDLATTSGLEAGVAAVDQRRALNVGVAEANMMLIGEAFAALGHQTWVSTFCPFYDWKVMRRVAVGHQERLESAAMRDGWLSDGHGLDLTMLATAANFETRTNGATHMGNDDCTIFDGTGPPEDHRRLLPAADAVADAVDHGGQPRSAVCPGDAHAVSHHLRQRLHVRVRQGPRAEAERRRRRGDRQQRPRRARGARSRRAVRRGRAERRRRGHAVDRRGSAASS